MRREIFVAAFLLLCVGRVGAQGVDSSCLVPWEDSPQKPPGVLWFNPDSVKVDMCPGPQYLEEFAKKKFLIAFHYFVVPISMDDTLVRTWRDIDTSYPGIRNELDSIEQRFGGLTMHLESPGDTSVPDDKSWWIDFDEYVNIDSAIGYLFALPDLNMQLEPSFGGRPSFYEDVNTSLPQAIFTVWPLPASSLLHISPNSIHPIPSPPTLFDELGRPLTAVSSPREGGAGYDLNVSAYPPGLYFLRWGAYGARVVVAR